MTFSSAMIVIVAVRYATLVGVSSWPAIAAANNAEWCDAVCQTRGIATHNDGRAWTSRTRTPPRYPDAITLVADRSASELLAKIDDSPGCSVKDSFATLDLTQHGFEVLFDAQWIVRIPSHPQPAPASPLWSVVTGVEAFTLWEDAWRGPDGPRDVLRADLLTVNAVTLLAAQIDDRIVGGAALYRSATVVGISNFFTTDAISSESWQGCLALTDALFPGVALVGYESGDALDVAQTHGFEAVGPLQVWIRDD